MRQGDLALAGITQGQVTVTFDQLDSDTTRHADIIFGAVTDTAYTPATASTHGSYAMILRQNGQFQLFKNGVQIGSTVATTAITVAGTAVPLKWQFSGGDVIVTRVDTGDSIIVADSTYRGVYQHWGKQLTGPTKLMVSFSSATVS